MERMKHRGRHPSQEELGRFMRGNLPRDEVRHIVRHMLTECHQCVVVTRRFWERGERSSGLEALLKKMAVAAAEGALRHNEPGLI